MADILFDFTIQAERQRIFETFCFSNHLINWWPLECSGKLEEGADYRFFFGEPYDWTAKVVLVEPFREVQWKFIHADEDWTNTLLGIRILDENGYCRIEFYHKNWPSTNAHFRKSSFCWAGLLHGWKNYTEKNTIIPFEERE